MSDLNAAESTVVPSKPTIDHFQRLPLELREMIYQYLLDARYTRLKWHTCNHPAYKFHTNILAVNHAIHAEAERYLYRVNTFVTASHISKTANSIISAARLWVPLVTWKYTLVDGKRVQHATRMQHNSLLIRFAHNSSDRLLNTSYSFGLGHTLETRFCVFLAADLSSYCYVLSNFMRKIKGPHFLLLEDGSLKSYQTRDSDR
jgi:hypothetical protein